ncbi:MAG: ATP-binding protein [Bacillota bacterium]
MKELSLHILDLVQNSISAEATLVEIKIEEDLVKDLLTIVINDNGKGMNEELLKKVKDPFVTTRTSRRVGLGISLMLAACQLCDGDLTITSEVNVGTKLSAYFRHSHIDRVPIGNMVETMISLILCSTYTDFLYKHSINNRESGLREFCFDTREVKQVLGEDVSLSEPDVLNWIKDYMTEGLSNISGGV